jgi:hypothetical protein
MFKEQRDSITVPRFHFLESLRFALRKVFRPEERRGLSPQLTAIDAAVVEPILM